MPLAQSTLHFPTCHYLHPLEPFSLAPRSSRPSNLGTKHYCNFHWSSRADFEISGSFMHSNTSLWISFPDWYYSFPLIHVLKPSINSYFALDILTVDSQIVVEPYDPNAISAARYALLPSIETRNSILSCVVFLRMPF